MRNFFLLFTVALTLSISASNARADTVILNGGFSVTSFTGNFFVSISGYNSEGTTFSANGSGSAAAGLNVPRPFMVNAGSSINMSGSVFVDWSDFNPGSSVVINGISSAPHSVNFNATSTSIMLPASTAATLVLTAPCTVSGGVSNGGILFQAGAGFTGLCGVTLNLSRMGTDGQGNGIYSFQSVSYSFRAAPTPEPATLILFGSGLLGVVGARLRKRQ